MRIRVNGEEQAIASGMTIQAYLDGYLRLRGFDGTLVSVELNFQVRPRQMWDRIRLSEGDNLEIIRFVGGG